MADRLVPPSPAASSTAVRAVMQGNRSHDTRPEAAVRSALHRLGFRFRKHARPIPELRCHADVVFRRERLAVFIDGCFWHGCPEHGRRPRTNSSYWNAKIQRNIDRDERNNEALRAGGWTVLRAWEHEAPELVADRVVIALKRASRALHKRQRIKPANQRDQPSAS
jgi:DNA mismatch endonuclease (patch repair protein)